MDHREPLRLTLTLRSLALLLAINLIVLGGLAIPLLRGQYFHTAAPALPTPTSSPTSQPSPSVTSSPQIVFELTGQPTVSNPDPHPTEQPPSFSNGVEHPGLLSAGWMVVSKQDNGFAHLFAYQPQSLPFTRLTDHPWDDINPAISPDGNNIAYASRQNGFWNLYLLNLSDGAVTQLTDNPQYDGSPTWSPDGLWIAYETYLQGHFQIAVLSVQKPDQDPIILTSDDYDNYSPAWSPQGRKIAFLSHREESDTLWVADLDQLEDRFHAILPSNSSRLFHPAWSPSGNYLAWGSQENGVTNLKIWDTRQPEISLRTLGSGDWPAWTPTDELLATRISSANQTFLAAYDLQTGALVLPPEQIPDLTGGLDWKPGQWTGSLPASLQKVAEADPTPFWTKSSKGISGSAGERFGIVPLADVSAPQPALSDQVDEAFQALRSHLAVNLGWDFLASLDNAYLPITSPLPPALEDDWLYTGRAISFSMAPSSAGWMFVAREDFGNDTYWRIFLKTRYQDGSQGSPLVETLWDLDARFSGDPQDYDRGGAPLVSIPSGYWLDFTQFASQFGWERLASASNWRAYYPGLHVNQLVHRDGLSWSAAMLELYPPEALITPTTVPTVGKTSTPYPYMYKTRTPTPTLAPSSTATPRATWTPIPVNQ